MKITTQTTKNQTLKQITTSNLSNHNHKSQFEVANKK